MNRTGKCGSDEEDSKKERNCVNQEESSCITYFRQCTIWNRVFKGFKEKYASYGAICGGVASQLRKLQEKELTEKARQISAGWEENEWVRRIVLEMISLLDSDDAERRRIALEVEKEMEAAEQKMNAA